MEETAQAAPAANVAPFTDRKADQRATLSGKVDALAEQLRTVGRAIETLARDIKNLKDSIG